MVVQRYSTTLLNSYIVTIIPAAEYTVVKVRLMLTLQGGVLVMAERGCGVVGGIFDNCAILFFILVFLLLFWNRGFIDGV